MTVLGGLSPFPASFLVVGRPSSHRLSQFSTAVGFDSLHYCCGSLIFRLSGSFPEVNRALVPVLSWQRRPDLSANSDF